MEIKTKNLKYEKENCNDDGMVGIIPVFVY